MPSLRRTFAIVAIVLVIAPLAARIPLFDPDEGLHAAIAQEMARTGDYVTPRFLGEPFLDKPILFFWTEALSLKVFGMNEDAVRIPPLLFAVLGMVSVAVVGRMLAGETAGLIAGIVYGTMLLPLAVSEVAVHDVAIVPFMCAAIWLLLRSEERLALPAAIGAGICLGLSILTKGLVGVVFTGIFAACFALVRRDAMMRLAVALTIAIIVGLFVAAPWYVAMERAHPGYLYYYFVERHLEGYLTATQRHGGRSWWYYLPVVVGGSLPWTGYLAGASRGMRRSRARLVAWGWFGLGLLFLSAGESKLATYALPLFPALAILVGETIATQGSTIDRIGYGVYAITLVLVPISAVIALQVKFGHVGKDIWIVNALISAAIGFVAVLSVSRTPRLASSRVSWLDFTGAAPRLSLMALFGLLVVGPRAAAWMTSRAVALKLNSDRQLPPHVLVVQERIGSLVFYLNPALRAEATPDRIDQASIAEAIQRSRAEPLDAIVIVRNNLLERFKRQFTVPPAPEWTAGTNAVFRVQTLQKALQGLR